MLRDTPTPISHCLIKLREGWIEDYAEKAERRGVRLLAGETGLWIVSADITGERDGRISYGPTAVINPQGQVVAQVPLLEIGMVTLEIPLPT